MGLNETHYVLITKLSTISDISSNTPHYIPNKNYRQSFVLVESDMRIAL